MALGWSSIAARAAASPSSNASSLMPTIRDQSWRWRSQRPERGGSTSSSELHRFVVLPKRWIVERTLAWISRCRRLAKDFERHARKAVAFIRLAMIRLMLRRLTAASP
jgi:transposase